MTHRGLGAALMVLTVAGVLVSGYLTWVHYAGLKPICAGAGGGCERVQTSDYAELAGVPVALVGLLGYLAILGALAIRDEAGRLAVAFLALIGVGFSAYLTYLELFVIDAICQWCVASAAIICVLLGAAVARLLGAPDTDHRR